MLKASGHGGSTQRLTALFKSSEAAAEFATKRNLDSVRQYGTACARDSAIHKLKQASVSSWSSLLHSVNWAEVWTGLANENQGGGSFYEVKEIVISGQKASPLCETKLAVLLEQDT